MSRRDLCGCIVPTVSPREGPRVKLMSRNDQPIQKHRAKDNEADGTYDLCERDLNGKALAGHSFRRQHGMLLSRSAGESKKG